MKRLLFFIVSLVFLTVFGVVSAELVLEAETYGSITAAVAEIPADAGVVRIILPQALAGAEDAVISLPSDRGIEKLEILLSDDVDSANVTGIEKICANGVPLLIGSGIHMDDTSIYGGSCVSGIDAVLERSSVEVNGVVGFVFGGGLAENGGSSVVRDTSVTIGKDALVYYEVFGGGHAAGNGSTAAVESSSVNFRGETDYLLGGSYAEAGGQASCDQTSLTVGEEGKVAVALFAGGSAADPDSTSTVGNALAIISGTAHWAFPGDFAFSGGTTSLTGAGRVEFLEGSSSVNAYLGSFASDPGSSAEINTAELKSCGSIETVTKRSLSTDGGRARTLIPALFPCDE